jgi:response regulator RpfG family c-di-GMP phosphodiesterase
VNLDPTALLTIGGPTGVISAIIALLIKTYFDAKKDNRDGRAADVQTDSGIVDNAKKVLELVRNETDRMEYKLIELAEENKSLREANGVHERKINEQEDTIARQARRIEFISEDLARALAEIEELKADRNGNHREQNDRTT